MKYISVVEFAEKIWRFGTDVRHYCASGEIEGAFLTGKNNVPVGGVAKGKGDGAERRHLS